MVGGEREREREKGGKIYTYIYVSRRLPGRRAVAHVARSKIYREHFAWSSEFDFAHHETPLLPLLLLLGGRYKVEEGWDDGDKSCDRNDSAKLLLARIRARNCPSLVVRLARCRSRPRAGRRRGRGVSSTQILRATPLRGKRQCPSPALNHARVRVAIGLLILRDCPRGAASRRVRVTLFAVSLGRFPVEGRVHAGGGDRGRRQGWGERARDWPTRSGRGGQPRRPRYRPREPRVRGLGSQPPRPSLVKISFLSLGSRLHRMSVLLSIEILSFPQSVLSPLPSPTIVRSVTFFFFFSKVDVAICSNTATNRFSAAIERTPPLPCTRSDQVFVEKNIWHRRSLFPLLLESYNFR